MLCQRVKSVQIRWVSPTCQASGHVYFSGLCSPEEENGQWPVRERRLHHERDRREGDRPIRGQYSGHVISLDQSEGDRGDPECAGCRQEQRDREAASDASNSGLENQNKTKYFRLGLSNEVRAWERAERVLTELSINHHSLWFSIDQHIQHIN